MGMGFNEQLAMGNEQLDSLSFSSIDPEHQPLNYAGNAKEKSLRSDGSEGF
jgi:hypothetical protein